MAKHDFTASPEANKSSFGIQGKQVREKENTLTAELSFYNLRRYEHKIAILDQAKCPCNLVCTFTRGYYRAFQFFL